MMQRHRKQLTLMSDINVTNLLDTAFLLLITFMVVAPQMNAGIRVNTPKVVDKTEPIQPKDPKKTIQVSIEKANTEDTVETVILTYLGGPEKGEKITIDKLKDKIVDLNAGRNKDDLLSVIVDTDAESLAGTFVRAMAAIKAGGVNNIGISAKSQDSKTPPGPTKPDSKTVKPTDKIK